MRKSAAVVACLTLTCALISALWAVEWFPIPNSEPYPNYTIPGLGACSTSQYNACHDACLDAGPPYAGDNWFHGESGCGRVHDPNTGAMVGVQCECNWWDAPCSPDGCITSIHDENATTMICVIMADGMPDIP